MSNRCVWANNPIIKDCAKELGENNYIVAQKVVSWQQRNNQSRMPTRGELIDYIREQDPFQTGSTSAFDNDEIRNDIKNGNVVIVE